MKKFFPLIAVAFIAMVTLISVVPDYKKSQEPFNKLLSFGKAEGFAVGVLVDDDASKNSAMQEIAKLEKMMGKIIPTKYYVGDTAIVMAGKQMLTVPAFMIIDGDGNLAIKSKGVVTAKTLVPYFSDLHTH